MKVTINRDSCIGCMLCVSVAEEVFEMDEDKNEVKAKVKELVDLTNKEVRKKIKEAAESCPVGVIKVEE
jgi:ferredoxin